MTKVLDKADFERFMVPDWDGYGANPLDPEAVPAMQRFIDLLPDYLPPYDDISPDSFGWLNIDWCKPGYWIMPSHYRLVVLVQPDHIYWAGVGYQGYLVGRFVGNAPFYDKIDQALIDLIIDLNRKDHD